MNESRKRLRQRMSPWVFCALTCISYPLAGSASGPTAEGQSLAEHCRAAAAAWTEDGPGIAFDDIDPMRAVPVCEQAVAENPSDGDLKAYLCIALDAANERERALNLCLAAAEQGSAAGMWSMGAFYDSRFNDRIDGQDEQAVAWYRKAAALGYPPAQTDLGSMYEAGFGLEPSAEMAVAWYRKAAEQGHVDAQYILGINYDIGRGVEEDDQQAVAWYRKAAEQGHADAQVDLGRMYEIGLGVEQSDAQAVAWYRQAFEEGDATFVEALRETRGHLPLHTLVAGHGEDEANIRMAVESAFSSPHGRLGVELLVALLADVDPWDRFWAASVLGELGDARAIATLIAHIGDDNASVRTAVVYALNGLDDGRAVEPLIDHLLKDEDREVRLEIAWCFKNFGDARAIEPLIQVFREDDAELRRVAAGVLGYLGGESAEEALIAHLDEDEEDAEVRAIVAGHLRGLQDARAAEPLIRRLEDTVEDAYVRGKIASALGLLGDPRSFQPLIRRLEDTVEDAGPSPVGC